MKSSYVPAPPSEGRLHDGPGLEFPDWSGMVPHAGRMSFEQAVRWNEEMLAMFPPKPNRPAMDADAKCHAEFRLP
jgi:hypothetical protein